MKNSKLLKLARIVLKFMTTMVGETEWIHEGELSTGTEVYIEDENGELIPVADGEYETENMKIVVKDGKIEEITEINKEPQEPQEPAQTTEPMAAEPTTEPQEPTTEPQPDEKDVKINELTAKIAELQAKIAVLVEEIDTKNDLIEELQEKLVKPLENPITMSATLRDGNGKTSGAMKYFE